MKMNENNMTTLDTAAKRFHDPWGIWVARIVRKRDQFLMRIWS